MWNSEILIDYTDKKVKHCLKKQTTYCCNCNFNDCVLFKKKFNKKSFLEKFTKELIESNLRFVWMIKHFTLQITFYYWLSLPFLLQSKSCKWLINWFTCVWMYAKGCNVTFAYKSAYIHTSVNLYESFTWLILYTNCIYFYFLLLHWWLVLLKIYHWWIHKPYKLLAITSDVKIRECNSILHASHMY